VATETEDMTFHPEVEADKIKLLFALVKDLSSDALAAVRRDIHNQIAFWGVLTTGESREYLERQMARVKCLQNLKEWVEKEVE
jgi:hypothetical protein